MSSLTNALIGEYRLTESLGAGGMGEVYKAVHVHFGRIIAVKVLSPSLADGPALQRFYNEASIQASLKHPSVAEYLGFFEYQGRPCILMEYVDGETLATLIQRQGPFPFSRALEILRDITAAISHFHAQGIVHRDLKTGNVKITTSGRVKILDFGIARHQHSDRMTHSGAVVGTTESLAPEQVRGEPAGFATDVWQLGVLFYELLTGRLPFQGNTIHDTYLRILSAQFTPVQQWKPEVPEGISAVVARCLQKEPSRRYPTAAEMHQALSSCLQSSAWQPQTKGRYSLRPAWIWSALGVLLLAAAITIFLKQWNGEGSSDAGNRNGEIENEAGQPGSSSSQIEPNIKIITVDTMDGVAQVVQGDKQIGSTPFQVKAHSGERVNLLLRREGFEDLPVQFDVSERHFYTYTLNPRKDR